MKSTASRNASLGGAITAAIAASACCLGPLLFALLGIGGAGFLVALEPYRPILTVITVAFLAVGWGLTYRKPATATAAAGASADDCGCEMPRANRTGKRLLWFATAMSLVALAFPYATPYLF